MKPGRMALACVCCFVPAFSELKAQLKCQPVRPLFTSYLVPNSNGPVVVLLDEDVSQIFPVLNNAVAGEPGTVVLEERDVFTGVEAVRVTPLQKYQPDIP